MSLGQLIGTQLKDNCCSSHIYITNKCFRQIHIISDTMPFQIGYNGFYNIKKGNNKNTKIKSSFEYFVVHRTTKGTSSHVSMPISKLQNHDITVPLSRSYFLKTAIEQSSVFYFQVHIHYIGNKAISHNIPGADFMCALNFEVLGNKRLNLSEC